MTSVDQTCSGTHRPQVLIFRNELLPSSETFIRSQAGALRTIEPHFIGIHAAQNSLLLPSHSSLLDSSASLFGKLRRRIFWRWSFAPAFYRRLRQLHPTLLHAHFAIDAAAALPFARSLDVPLVVTLHGYDVTSTDAALSRSAEGRIYLRRRKQLWRQASVFLCVSRFIAERALAQGFPRDKLRVHYTGTDLSLFAPSSLPRDPNLILFVGRLVEKKGCRYLLDALEIVRRAHPQVRLVCIGTGPLLETLQSQASLSRLPCTFLGAQAPETVRDFLARARVFCVPSVEAATGDSEGLGMVFAEAQAMGTPVVSFRHGGIPEVVLHGKTGLLAPERDRDILAAHLLTLLQNDALWHSYSECGLKWIPRAFNLQTQTSELETIYRQVIETASCPAPASRGSQQAPLGSSCASASSTQATSSLPAPHQSPG